MPYTEFQQLGDPFMVPPARNYWKSRYLNDLFDGVIDVLVEHTSRLPSPQSQVILHLLGGQIARVPADATAYPHRDARFEVNIQARWDDPADDHRVIGWARSTHAALAPFTTGGSYVNTMAGDEPDGPRSRLGSEPPQAHRGSEALRPDQPVPLERRHRHVARDLHRMGHGPRDLVRFSQDCRVRCGPDH